MDLKGILQKKLNHNDIEKNISINKNSKNYAFLKDLKKQSKCDHDWNEVRVWSFGATYIKCYSNYKTSF